MIAILDYDAGNVKSVEKALDFLGAKAKLTGDEEDIMHASGIILPGQGAFGSAMENLTKTGLIPLLKERIAEGVPFLGICVGLQLLFSESEESPGVKGLEIFPGKIVRFPSSDLKVPHIGWNSLTFPKTSRLFSGINEDAYCYFVHSYYLKSEDASIVSARSSYGVTFDAAVEKDNVFATQFHPEKSSKIGLKILENFIRMTEEER